ncbi:MAG: DNA-binding response regulator [Saprospiraceae bacterium]|nr:MAG: DNA-binding response regulator [Saprospiraceae bacterium]
MKQQYTFIVVEDVDLQRKYLVQLLQARLDLTLLAQFENAEDAFAYISDEEQANPDIIFLDVEMPEANAFSLLDAIKHNRGQTRVILTTAFSEYAIKGYDYDITSYLLKPIDETLLYRAIDKGIEELIYLETVVNAAPNVTDQAVTKGHLMIKEKGRWIKIDYEEILYCEGANVNVKVVTPGTSYLTRERVKNLEQQLPPDRFLRIHDSFIVNLNHVKSYAGNFSFVEVDGIAENQTQTLNIGPSYRERVQSRIEDFFGN